MSFNKLIDACNMTLEKFKIEVSNQVSDPAYPNHPYEKIRVVVSIDQWKKVGIECNAYEGIDSVCEKLADAVDKTLMARNFYPSRPQNLPKKIL